MATRTCSVAITVPATGQEAVATTDGSGIGRYLRSKWSGAGVPKMTMKDAVILNLPDDCQRLIHGAREHESIQEIRSNYLLHAAVLHNSLSMVRILLGVVDDDALFCKNLDGKTALHCAVEQKNLDCCEAIMTRNSSSLMQKDFDGCTPLHLIAKTKYLKACEVSMTYATPECINEPDLKHLTAVHLAARENNESILKLLLDNGGKPEAKTLFKYTPLHYAADNGFNKCLGILVKANYANRKQYIDAQNNEGSTALMLAAKKGFSACCRSLSDASLDLQDKRGFTALHYAASKGYFSIVQYLVEHNANISIKNNKNQTALFHAASSYNEKCLSYLLEKSETYEGPEDLLKIATSKNCYQCLEVLLSYQQIKKFINHQFSNEENNTLLHFAIKKGNYKITELLLSNGAGKNIANNHHEYPLHLAAAQLKLESRYAEEERLEVCRTVLKNSHEIVNKTNKSLKTPLHLAARSGNLDMIRSLLKKGSKVLAQESGGLTTVHVAAQAGHEAAVKVLLRSLNTMQVKELAKIRPHHLHLAAQCGRLLCCKTIVSEFRAGRQLTVMDGDGLFPVDLSLKHDQYDVFRYLLCQMPYDAALCDFSCRLHQYCKQSIRDRNEQVLDAIVDSQWCGVAFDGYYCAGVRQPGAAPELCDSFGSLVKEFPQTACRVMDVHIAVAPDSYEEVHTYTPFEFIYYAVSESGEVEPSFSASPPHGVVSSAKQFPGVTWGCSHPLLEASRSGCAEVLQHRLTRSWLHNKFVSYARWLLYGYVGLDVITAIFTAIMFSLL